jgi:predicted MPP superfamily phosphohydrolase
MQALYAVLGNHDFGVGAKEVSAALEANGITVLRNACVPIERGGGRIWLAGLDDPLEGHANPELAIPEPIRNVPNEPVVLMCHAPDFADRLLTHPAGQAVDLMLSGHTHGGQIRVPFRAPTGPAPAGQKVYRRQLPARPSATLRQSRHRRHWAAVSSGLSAGDHSDHAACWLMNRR